MSMDIKLFESGEFADCTINCNGREFKTHRLILSSRSQYFRRAFNGKWQESRTGEVSLNDHEPEKIEWLLRFIYHQDLEWHRAYKHDREGFLPMLIELVILGDYFLVNGLVDAARAAILDVCSSFAVELWSRDLSEPTKRDGTIPSFELFMNEVIKAIAITSAISGPTRIFRKFLVKFIVDIFGCTPGISAWSQTETLMYRRHFRLAVKLHNLTAGVPGLEDELKAALFDSAFPKLTGDDSDSLPVLYSHYAHDNECSACWYHLDDDGGDEGLVFSPTYGSGRETCCLHCAKDTFKLAWKALLIDDDSREEESSASTDQDLPEATA